ncbi:YciI family protein [Sanguibacter sp. 25GB23B1]|uniref:YciI family protein n=1 Tax=unclassified Sanguibacter TaxID=2645534 RepID=UPI0032AED0FB
MMSVVVTTDGEPYVAAEDTAPEWDADLERHGVLLHRRRLQPVEDATTVRERGGRLVLTDGPFTESKEWIAGFAILEVADLDEAVAIAATHPMARFGALEVRALWGSDE